MFGQDQNVSGFWKQYSPQGGLTNVADWLFETEKRLSKNTFKNFIT